MQQTVLVKPSHVVYQEGFQVIAVGRDGPGRSDDVVKYLNDCTTLSSSPIKHESRPCDAFDLGQVKSCALELCVTIMEELMH